MEIAGNIFSVFFIAAMSWQDFRTRTIAAWLLPVIGITLLLGEISTLSKETLFQNALVNYSLLTVQFVLLWLWMSLRKRKWINIIDTQIGLGDILLLICIAPAFSPINFFLFYTTGAVLAIVLQITMLAIRENHQKRIPLAGMLGFPLVALCIVRLISPTLVDITSDVWLIDSFLY